MGAGEFSPSPAFGALRRREGHAPTGFATPPPAPSPAPRPPSTDAPEANKSLVRRYLEDILNRGDLAAADDLFAGTFVDHDPAGPQGLVEGPEGFRQLARFFRQALGPEVRFTIESQLAEGDKVATRWTCHGVHRGPILGLRPTQREVRLAGITIDRVVRGRIIERWVQWDALGLARQLGAELPPPRRTFEPPEWPEPRSSSRIPRPPLR